MGSIQDEHLHKETHMFSEYILRMLVLSSLNYPFKLIS